MAFRCDGGCHWGRRRDLSPGGTLSSDFQVPFAGLYTAFSKGNFFADAQARFDYFQSELNDPNANGIFNQRLDARGYSITGNAGYRFDLGGNWSLEPSVGGVYSSTSVYRSPWAVPMRVRRALQCPVRCKSIESRASLGERA